MSNSNENDEIKEFQTISIEEAVKLKKEQRDKRNEEFHQKLAELQKKTDELKKQINDERT